MAEFKYINGLHGFGYYEVPENFELELMDTDYFKNEVLDSELLWNGQPIRSQFATAANPSYDSGVICALSSDLEQLNKKVSSLKCFLAPYRLMNATIKSLNKTDQVEHKRVRLDKLKDDVAVGIGMVLTVIATQGSGIIAPVGAENSLEPYIMLTERHNPELRNKSWDVAAVEGLCYTDFLNTSPSSSDSILKRIAKRTLEEERGINIDMLVRIAAIHFPTEYYLGYDEQYHQWNFFGTIEIDLSAKEIIDMGQYYTKDKFETQNINCIPMSRSVLSYYLSLDKITFMDARGGHEVHVQTQEIEMWNTAWASISFALMNYGGQKNKHKGLTLSCLMSKYNVGFRHIFHWICPITSWIADKSVAWEGLKTFSPLLLPLAGYFTKQIGLIMSNSCAFGRKTYQITTKLLATIPVLPILTAVGVLLTALFMWAKQYAQVIRKRPDLIRYCTFSLSNESININDVSMSIFDHFTLRDGCVTEENREVFLSLSNDASLNQVCVTRKNSVFINNANEANHTTWSVDLESIRHNEDMLWVFPKSKTRVVVVCTTKDGEKILCIKDDKGHFRHPIDFCTNWESCPTGDMESMKAFIYQEAANILKKEFSYTLHPEEIHIRLLWEYDSLPVIVAFASLDDDRFEFPAKSKYDLAGQPSNIAASDLPSHMDPVTCLTFQYAKIASPQGYILRSYR